MKVKGQGVCQCVCADFYVGKRNLAGNFDLQRVPRPLTLKLNVILKFDLAAPPAI